MSEIRSLENTMHKQNLLKETKPAVIVDFVLQADIKTPELLIKCTVFFWFFLVMFIC